MRTPVFASRIRGRRVGRMTLTGCGRGELTGRELMEVVRWARESRRWESDLELRRETWCVNCVFEVGAFKVRDCWFRTIPRGLVN